MTEGILLAASLGPIMAPLFLGLLFAMNAILPSWRWFAGSLTVLFVGLAVMWGLLLTGFQPRDVSVEAYKMCLAFMSSGLLIGTACFGLLVAWPCARVHYF